MKDPRRSQDMIMSTTRCAFFFLLCLQIPLGVARSFLDSYGSKNDFKCKAKMKKKRIDTAALLINLSFMQKVNLDEEISRGEF